MNDQAENKSIVLIVDDSLTNLAVFSEYLSRLNCEVLVAINGVDALAQLEEHKPDIILLDVIMPGIDGFETCRRLKRNPETKDIPVIFMTTLADTVDKVKGLSMGAVDYVTKPFQEEEVVARIKTHITISRLQKELRAQNAWLQQEINERREAEDKLHRRNAELHYSETRFRDLAMSLSDWLWECNDRFFLTYSSGRVMDILGYSVEEVVGKTPFEFMSIEETTQFEMLLTQAMSAKESIDDLEHWVQHKEGHSICLQTSGLPVFDTMGRVVGYRGASKDITERKEMEQIAREYNTMLEMEVAERTRELEENARRLEQEIAERQQMEAALQLSEERLSLAIHGAHYGLWDWHLDSNELYLSPRWKELLGYKDEEIPNHPEQWKRRIHPEDLPQAMAAISDYLKGRTPVYENIFRMLHRDGHYLWMLERGVTVRDERQRPNRFVGTLMELSAQNQMEEGLRHGEQRYDLALRAADEGLWDWNLSDDSVYFSARWKQMLGYEDHEVAAQLGEWRSRIHPDDQEAVQAAIETYLQKEQAYYRAVYRMRYKNGNYIWLLDRGSAVWNDEGKAVRFVGTCMDITGFKQAENNLRHLNERCNRVFNAVTEAFWEWHLRDNRAWFPAQWNQLIGYPEYEDLGSDLEVFRKRLHPEDAEAVMAQFNAYLAREVNELSLEHRLQHYDGRWLWLITQGMAEWDAHNKPVTLTVTHRDVSELKRLEADLQQTESYFRDLIQTAGMGLVVMHYDGSILEANPAFADLLGYRAEDILQYNVLTDLTPAAGREADKQHLKDLKTRAHFGPYDKALLHCEGHEVPVRVSGIFVARPGAQLIWMNVEKL